jgi:hypothetical protein
MRSLKTIAIAATAALALGLGGMSAANAQRVGGGFHGAAFHGGGFRGGFHGGGFRGGWHGGGWRGGRGWGWGAGAVAGGLALGALATAPYWGGYYDCGETIVGYDPYGNPLVSNTCY